MPRSVLVNCCTAALLLAAGPARAGQTNLVANLLFMPIFAGLRNVPLAAADILIV